MKRTWTAIALLVASLGITGVQCVPEATETLRSSVSGIAAQRGIEPASTAFVFVAENPLDATVVTPDGRFNLFTLERGDRTIVAADQLGYAGSLGVVLDGRPIDVGVLPLSVCGVNAPDGSVDPCPDSPLSTQAPAPLALPSFEPDTTDVALTAFPTTTINLHAVSLGQSLALNVMLPTTSEAFQPGTYTTGTDISSDPLSVLLFRVDDVGDLYVYRLLQGTLRVNRLDAFPGGVVSMSIENAVFAWLDPSSGQLDSQNTVVIDHTGTTMAGVVVGTDADPGEQSDGTLSDPAPEAGGIPPTSVSVGAVVPDFVIAHPDDQGGVYVYSSSPVDAETWVSLDLHIPSGVAGSLSSYAVSNTLSGGRAQWEYTVSGLATLETPEAIYPYALQSGVLDGQTGALPGDLLNVTLSAASFVFTPDYDTTIPDYTLTIDTIPMSATLEDPYGTPGAPPLSP